MPFSAAFTRETPLMSRTFGLLAMLALPCLAVACSQEAGPAPDRAAETADELRGLSKREALEEFDQVAEAIRSFYRPREYKKQKLGFNFEAAIAEGRAAVEAGQNEAD